MAITSPEQLLALKLQHIQDAEAQAAEALDEMRRDIDDPDLLDAIRRREQEGQSLREALAPHLARADGAAGADPQNHAARGIIQEGRMLLSEIQDPQLKEAIAIGSLQSLEHYCIATWGTVKALAREMGEEEIVQVMQGALDSGKQLDALLTQIAESRVNPAAMDGAGGRGAQADEEQRPQA